MPTLPCPSPADLEQFLLGALDDTASQRLETHLASCHDCGKQAASIPAKDEVVEAIQSLHGTHLSATSTLADVPADLVRLLVPHYQRVTALLDETIAPVANAGLAETIVPARAATVIDSPKDKLGPYEIRGILGSGGMGTVLHAFDPLLKRSVAIKVIQPKYLADAAMQERLVKEAQAAAAVEHENIVSIFAVEAHNGAPCILMPLLKGVSLKQRLDETPGLLPVNELLRVAREMTPGLAAAHASGLIHRDLKPANIWLEAPRERVKILDFGLAIASGDESARLEGISGTPGFLAPEQARRLPLDQRTDLFSLGCVLYLMATGRVPFHGEKSLRVLWTVLAEPPPPAIQFNPQLPPELSDLIDRMLAQDPAERPASCAVVLETIDAIERRSAAQQGMQSRRRWLAAVVFVALLSSSSVALWAWLTAVPAAEPVKTTILGDTGEVAVVLRHEGSEQTLTLGREKTLDLLPGDYAVRLATALPGRSLVPDRFTVSESKPQTVRIAVVGEIAKHSTHTMPVTSVAAVPSPGGLLVYSVGLDRVLARWEPASVKPPRFVEQPPTELAIRIWESQQLVARGEPLEGHERLIHALAYSPNGKQLASAGADGVLLWNLATSASTVVPQANPHAVYAVAFSENGEQLLTGGDEGHVELWNVRTNEHLQTHVPSPATVRSVAFLGERIVAAGDDGIIRIWNAGKLQHEWLGHQSPVLALAAAADGRQVISGDAAGNILVWSVARGETVHTLRADHHAVNALSYLNPMRQAVSGGADGCVRLWQLPFGD
jgi:WD40 repeat protein